MNFWRAGCGSVLVLAAAAAGTICHPLPAAEPFASRLTVAGCSLPNTSLLDAVAQFHDLGFSGVEIATFADEAKPNAPDRHPWVVLDRLSETEKIG